MKDPSSEPQKPSVFLPNQKADYTTAGVKYSVTEDLASVKAAKLDTDKRFLEQLKLGIVDVNYDGGLNYRFDTSNPNNLSRADYGDMGNDTVMRMNSSIGFGEENISQKKYRLNAFNNKPHSMTPHDMEASYLESLWAITGEHVVGNAEREEAHAEMVRTLQHKDPAWTPEAIYKTINDDVSDEIKTLLAVTGTDITQLTVDTRNQKHFEMVLYEAIHNGITNLQLGAYEDTHGLLSKTGDFLGNMAMDPSLVRDIAVGTALTFGLAAPQVIGARMGASSVAAARAAGVAAEAASRASATTRFARLMAKPLQYVSPTTGLVEGAVFPGMRGALGAAGFGKNAQVVGGRLLAIGTEGAVAGGLSAARDQRDAYEWKKLLNPGTEAFKYKTGEILSGAVMGFGAGVALGGLMRGVTGLIGGEGRLIKAKNWNELGRQWASSFDTWAQTKGGLTIFGDALSDGRGMWFGNTLDKYMARKVDGRTLADVMVNGTKLWNNFRFDEIMAAKQNFDDAAAVRIADKFEQLTGIPPSAIEAGVKGTEDAQRIFPALVDPEMLEATGMTYKDIEDILDGLLTKEGPQPRVLADITTRRDALTGREVNARTETNLRMLPDALESAVQARILGKAGLEYGQVVAEAEKLVGKSLNTSYSTSRSTIHTVATKMLGDKNGETVSTALRSALSGTEDIVGTDGVVAMKGEAIKNALSQTLGLEGRTEPLYLTDGGFIIKVDPDGTVERLSTKLESDGKGGFDLRPQFDQGPSFKPDNTMSMETMQARFAEFKTKVQAEIEKFNKAKKDAAKAETLSPEVEADIGKLPTKRVLMKHFNLSAKEATVASIVMNAMGYDATQTIIKIARAKKIEEGALGDIVATQTATGGIRALIRTTEHSDFGTLVHEMAHYARIMFIGNTPEAIEFRRNIGISDPTWEGFLKWAGNEANDWSGNNLVAEEKFANGFAFFIKNLMNGSVKSPTTGVQRLFMALGNHMGEVAKEMKSQKNMEAEITMTPEAEEVYSRLINLSEDRLSGMFDVAYSDLFRTLPPEDREVVGKTILGEAAWEAYKADKQIRNAKAAEKNNPLIAAAAIPKANVEEVVNNVLSRTKADRVREFVRQALRLGEDEDKIVRLLDFAVTAQQEIDEANAKGEVIRPRLFDLPTVVPTTDRRLSFLSSDTVTKLIASGEETHTITYRVRPVIKTIDGKKQPDVEVIAMVVTIDQLKDLEAKRQNRKVKAEARLTALKETRDAMKAAKAAGFVDSAGVPVPLTNTEKLAITAKASEDAVVTAARSTAIAVSTAAADPSVPLESIRGAAVDPVVPDKINVEAPAEEVDAATLAVVRANTAELEAKVEEAAKALTPYQLEKAKTAAAFAAANPLTLPKIREALEKDMDSSGDPLSPEMVNGLIEYVKLEARFLIAKGALEDIAGKANDVAMAQYAKVSVAVMRLPESVEINLKSAEDIAAKTKLSVEEATTYIEFRDLTREHVRQIRMRQDLEFVTARDAEIAAGKTLAPNVEGKYKAAKARLESTAAGEVADIDSIPDVTVKPKETVHISSAVNPPDSQAIRMEALKSIPNLGQGLLATLGRKKSSDVFAKLMNMKDLNGFFAYMFSVEKAGIKDIRIVMDAWATNKPLPPGFPPIDMARITRTLKRIALNAETDEFRKFGKRTMTGEADYEGPSRIERSVEKTDAESYGTNRAMVWGNMFAGSFYQYLLQVDRQDLAEYFTVRRSMYFVTGNKVDIAREAFEARFGKGELGETTKVTELESQLNDALADFAEELELEDLPGPSQLIRDELAKSRNKEPIKAFGSDKVKGREFLFSQNTLAYTFSQQTNSKFFFPAKESNLIVAEIEQGLLPTAAKALERVVELGPKTWQAAAAKALLSVNRELLESHALFALSSKHELGTRMFDVNIIGISTDVQYDAIQTLIHESVHAVTGDIVTIYDQTGGELLSASGPRMMEVVNDAINQPLPGMPKSVLDVLKAYQKTLIWAANHGIVDINRLGIYRTSTDIPYMLSSVHEFMVALVTEPKMLELVSAATNSSSKTVTGVHKAMTELIFASGATVRDVSALQGISTSLTKLMRHTDTFRADDLEGRMLDIVDLYDSSGMDKFYRKTPNNLIVTPFEHYVARQDMADVITDLGHLANDPQAKAAEAARQQLNIARGRHAKGMRLIDTVRFAQKKLDPADLEEIGGKLGTNNAKQLKSKTTGETYYAKEQLSEDHAETEVLAQKLYALLGIKGVEGEINYEGLAGLKGPVLITKWIDKTMYAGPQDNPKLHKALVPAAWLAHWDVAGSGTVTNISGEGLMLDAGGALHYRALGTPKGNAFGDSVTEMSTLRDPNINPMTAGIFADTPHNVIVDSVKNLLAVMTDDVIDLTVDSHITDNATASMLKKKLKARRQDLYEKFVKPDEIIVEKLEIEMTEVLELVLAEVDSPAMTVKQAYKLIKETYPNVLTNMGYTHEIIDLYLDGQDTVPMEPKLAIHMALSESGLEDLLSNVKTLKQQIDEALGNVNYDTLLGPPPTGNPFDPAGVYSNITSKVDQTSLEIGYDSRHYGGSAEYCAAAAIHTAFPAGVDKNGQNAISLVKFVENEGELPTKSEFMKAFAQLPIDLESVQPLSKWIKQTHAFAGMELPEKVNEYLTFFYLHSYSGYGDFNMSTGLQVAAHHSALPQIVAPQLKHGAGNLSPDDFADEVLKVHGSVDNLIAYVTGQQPVAEVKAMDAHAFDQLLANIGVEHNLEISDRVEDFISIIANRSKTVGLKQAAMSAFKYNGYHASYDLLTALEGVSDEATDMDGVVSMLRSLPPEEVGTAFNDGLHSSTDFTQHAIDALLGNFPSYSASAKALISSEVREIIESSHTYGFRSAVVGTMENRGPLPVHVYNHAMKLPETPASYREVELFFAGMHEATGTPLSSLFTQNNVRGGIGADRYDEFVAKINLTPQVAGMLFYRVLTRNKVQSLKDSCLAAFPNASSELRAAIAELPDTVLVPHRLALGLMVDELAPFADEITNSLADTPIMAPLPPAPKKEAEPLLSFHDRVRRYVQTMLKDPYPYQFTTKLRGEFQNLTPEQSQMVLRALYDARLNHLFPVSAKEAVELVSNPEFRIRNEEDLFTELLIRNNTMNEEQWQEKTAAALAARNVISSYERGFAILDKARVEFENMKKLGYPVEVALQKFASSVITRESSRLSREVMGKLPGLVAEVYAKTKIDRKKALAEWATGPDGKDILYRDELGIPVILTRSLTSVEQSKQTSLYMDADAPYRFFGERDLAVAGDYGTHESPIIEAVVAVEPGRVLSIERKTPGSFSDIEREDYIRAIEANTAFSPELKQQLLDAFNPRDYIGIDKLASQLVGTGLLDAVRVTGNLDLLQTSGYMHPHTQWAIATKKNIVKSTSAFGFSKEGKPSYFTQKDLGPKGGRAERIKAEADKLSASLEGARKNLKSLGLDESISSESMSALSNLINGLPFGGVKTPGMPTSPRSPRLLSDKPDFESWRSLSTEERRLFLQDHIMPTIQKLMGNRNQTAGAYSKLTDSVLGKRFNALIGGAVSYGDVTDSNSLALQFLGKMFDPASDLRDGELGNAFYIPNMDQIHAEGNNLMIKSGIVDVRDQIMRKVKTAEEAEKINDTAWLYLTDPDKVPADAPHRQLIMNLIEAQTKFNTDIVNLMVETGMISKGMDPAEYGTIRRADTTAYQDPEGFANALTEHAVARTKALKEISLVTADAMGWVQIHRSGTGEDDIVSITVPKSSPLADLFDEKELDKKLDWDSKTRAKFSDVELLKSDVRARHDAALEKVTSDYTEGWRKTYAGKPDHTALRQAMTIARDRYLGYDLTDTKTHGPRQLSMGNGRNFLEERILSHREIANNPALAKYFDKDLGDLNYQLIRGQVTDALMTKKVSELFGVRLTFSDLVEVLRGAEAAKDVKLDKTAMESRSRGFDRVRDVWNDNIGKIESSKDSLDKYYKSLLENSRVSVLLLSGLRAAMASGGEVTRAIFTSDKHRTMLTQALPNFVKLVQLTLSKDKRRGIQELSSATHWMRGLSTEHLMARSEMRPDNPFGGIVLGARQPGFFARFVQDWRAIGKINERTSNRVTRAMNYVSMASKVLGGPLALVNDVTTTMHIWNLQRNLTDNSSNFMRLGELLEKGGTQKTVAEFRDLAAKAGLTQREAIALSTQGLLDPQYLKLMVQAASDQRNYTDGLLDVRKLYRWAGTDKARLETISRMGGLVNMTARETNADPTLLDVRIAQSSTARALNVFQQFILSHSVQDIGRRRRWGTTDYSKHLIGLVAMEMMVTSLMNAYDSDTGEWAWEKVKEDPIDFIIKSTVRVPLLGGIQWVSALVTYGLLWGKSLLDGEEVDQEVYTPKLIGGPAAETPRKAWSTLEDMIK